MTTNAYWNVEAREKATGNYIGVYLNSPDLADLKEAHKRARAKAIAKWKTQGIAVVRVVARCVG